MKVRDALAGPRRPTPTDWTFPSGLTSVVSEWPSASYLLPLIPISTGRRYRYALDPRRPAPLSVVLFAIEKPGSMATRTRKRRRNENAGCTRKPAISEKRSTGRVDPQKTSSPIFRWWWLWGPICAGMLLRGTHLAFIAGEPALRDFLLLDSVLYDQMARSALGGDLLVGTAPFAVGPLYAYVLASLRLLFGDSNLPVFLFQGTLGLGSVALVTLLARRLSGPCGACAAGITFAPEAFSPPSGLVGRH